MLNMMIMTMTIIIAVAASVTITVDQGPDLQKILRLCYDNIYVAIML